MFLTALVVLAAQSQASGPTPTEVQIIDSTGSNEIKAQYISTNILSCSYFIKELSDEGNRLRVDALRTMLSQKLSSELAGHKLEVTSYRIFFNQAAQMVDFSSNVAAASVTRGAGGGARTATAPKCSKEKTPHGWFDPSETSNSNPPLIVEISATIDGKPVAVQTVRSPNIALDPIGAFGALGSSKKKKNLADDKAAPEVDAAVDKANAEMVKTLKGVLSGS